MKKPIFILFVIALLPFISPAQEEGTSISMTGVGFVPQYTISGGLRFDVDLRLTKTSNQWLTLSPQIYWVTGYRYDHEFESLKGLGMDVKHRIFLNPESIDPAGVYVQYGVMAQYFSIIDNRQYGEYYEENGVIYYGVSEGEIETRLLKVGGNFHLGYQWLFGKRVYLDVYAGPGIRISHNNRTEGFDTWYNNSWIDYGYSGTLLDGGFRLGFYF